MIKLIIAALLTTVSGIAAARGSAPVIDPTLGMATVTLLFAALGLARARNHQEPVSRREVSRRAAAAARAR
jgi:lipopolysaccharide export LptBFGC system permease protein LptF